jgi:hypothetical protein
MLFLVLLLIESRLLEDGVELMYQVEVLVGLVHFRLATCEIFMISFLVGFGQSKLWTQE